MSEIDKTFFPEKNSPKKVSMDTEKGVLTSGRKIFNEKPKFYRSMTQMVGKNVKAKNLLLKMFFLGHVECSFDNLVVKIMTRRWKFSAYCPEVVNKNSKKEVSPQGDPSGTRRIQSQQPCGEIID